MKTVQISTVRNTVMWLWLIWSGLLFLYMALRSARWMTPTVETDKLQEIWAWFIPLIAPVTTMITVVSMVAFRHASAAVIRRSYFILALAVSCFYLFVISVTCAADNIILLFQSDAPSQMEVYKASQIWLVFLEVLIMPIITTLFVSTVESDT